MHTFLRFAVASAVLLAAGCKTPAVPTTPEPTTAPEISATIKYPKNIVLMIGDGMGLTQITAGLYMNNNKLALEEFTHVGLHKSYAADDLVTDSASGATAFACGKKTYNAAIGVGVDTLPLPTILEQAEAKGMATGLVATSTIVHATPASFIAHVKHRDEYEEIATWFLKTDIDLFIGGGKKFFDRRESDERSLSDELKAKGYIVSDYFQADIDTLTIPAKSKFAFYTADKDPLPVAQGRTYLTPASKKSLVHLDNQSDKGFFLMIEGSQIDWGGHANNSNYIVTEMLDFNKAIEAVLQWAKADGETLVIVTADHETGGYAINPGSKMGDLKTEFTTDKHTAALIPVFAFGPGASLFSGIYENTEIYWKMKQLLKIKSE